MSHGALQCLLVLLFFLSLLSRFVVASSTYGLLVPLVTSRLFLGRRIVPWASLCPHPGVCRFSGGYFVFSFLVSVSFVSFRPVRRVVGSDPR